MKEIWEKIKNSKVVNYSLIVAFPLMEFFGVQVLKKLDKN